MGCGIKAWHDEEEMSSREAINSQLLKKIKKDPELVIRARGRIVEARERFKMQRWESVPLTRSQHESIELLLRNLKEITDAL